MIFNCTQIKQELHIKEITISVTDNDEYLFDKSIKYKFFSQFKPTIF